MPIFLKDEGGNCLIFASTSSLWVSDNLKATPNPTPRRQDPKGNDVIDANSEMTDPSRPPDEKVAAKGVDERRVDLYR